MHKIHYKTSTENSKREQKFIQNQVRGNQNTLTSWVMLSNSLTASVNLETSSSSIAAAKSCNQHTDQEILSGEPITFGVTKSTACSNKFYFIDQEPQCDG